MKNILFAIAVILLALTPVFAHGELSAQINQLTQQIKLDEKNADLYLQRGELYRLNGNAKAALEDYGRTQKLNPKLSEVDLARARLFFDAAMPEMAKFSLKSFLTSQPNHTEALILLAIIPVLAHGELSGQINQLTQQIKQDEKNANLYLAYNRRFYAGVIKAQEIIESDGGVKSLDRKSVV